MRRTRADSAPRLSHNVYVVELDPAVLKRRAFRARNPAYRPDMPCVYVGMTGLPPGERFQNHKAGVKANWFVKKYGKGLLPDLFAHLNPMPYAKAQQMEIDLAESLRKRGYLVFGGH